MVEEEGSLTKAGDKLFLSQSALSHQLKEMETQLGASVFHRINKKLVLTSVGKIVLQSAHKVLLELDKGIVPKLSGPVGYLFASSSTH